MRSELRGAELKLWRAKQHLDCLKAYAAKYEGNLRAASEADKQAAELGVPIMHTIQPPPDWWSVLAGDALNDVRCALDYLAYELARHYKVPKRFSTYFPIYTERQNWEGDAKARVCKACGKRLGDGGLEWVNHIPSPLVAYLDQLQPYKTENVAMREHHALRVLQRLSNRDKHRALNVTLLRVPDTWSYIAEIDDFHRVTPISQANTGTPGGGKPEMDVKIGDGPQVGLDDGTLVTPLHFLPLIWAYAEKVVNQGDLYLFDLSG